MALWTDGFEDGNATNDGWERMTSNPPTPWQATTNHARSGSYSATAREPDNNDHTYARCTPSELAGGRQIKVFEYYWREVQSPNQGGGVRLKNSNGNVEVAVATNNPQWIIDSGQGIAQFNNGTSYGAWVRFTLVFDWANSEVTVTGEAVDGSTSSSITRPLKDGVDIEKWTVENYNSGTWRGNSSFQMWFDDFTANETPAAPSGVSASSPSPGTVDLTWTDNSSIEEGVYVYRDGTQIADLPPDTTSYTDNNATTGTTHTYEISAYSGDLESGTTSDDVTVTLDAPGSASATVDANDSISVSWDSVSSADSYDVQISRDGGAFEDPAGGPSNTTNTGATYGPSSDSAYGRVVGIDSSFQFRVRARTSDGATSNWTTSGTAYTDPIPPASPTVGRPDADALDLYWTNSTDVFGHVELQYRKDSGTGYGSWTQFTTDPDTAHHVDTAKYSWFGTDARYQFRARTVAPNGRSSEWVHFDFGNKGNVFFEDDFESGDLSKWTTTQLSDGQSGVRSDGHSDVGVSGADEGSNWLRIDGGEGGTGDHATKHLGDLSGESDVIFKCAMATGSMDNNSEWTTVQWYDGSQWRDLVDHGWEFNKQGWVEVSATVPDSWLSTDNRLRLWGTGSLFGGDHSGFDRVIVSDVLHEYTKPAAPSDLSLNADTEGEITGAWTLGSSLSETSAHFQEWRQRRTNSGDPLSKTTVEEATTYTASGLRDGEKYDIRVDAVFEQYRRGTIDTWYRGSGTLKAVTTFQPAPTNLSSPDHDATSIGLTWTDNHDYGDTQVQYKPTDVSSWTVYTTVSRGTESETITDLRTGEAYDVRVLAVTEHVETEDN